MPSQKLTSEQKPDGSIVLNAKGPIISTLDELLESTDADLTLYEVERWIANAWSTTMRGDDGRPMQAQNWQVKAWLTPRRLLIDARAYMDALLDELRAEAPAPPTLTRPPAPPGARTVAVEVAIYDLHLGMLAWGEEAGEDYDSGIAERLFLGAIDRVLERTAHLDIAEWMLPIGHDLLHVDTTIDGKGGATNRGTPQDVDSRWQKMARRCRIMLREGIERLRQRAPVRVYGVPGNHDRERAWWLVETLACLYDEADDVTFDNSPRMRKYWRYGQCMVQLTHGHLDKRKNPALIMATDEPEMWAATRYREQHKGHGHTKDEVTRQDVKEERGVRYRQIPSLAASDSWHADQGYLHLRCMEAFVWHADWGCQETISVGAEEILDEDVA